MGLQPRSNRVIFRNESHDDIPLPNPAFIKLHAALCGIFHMTGAGDDIDNIVQQLKKDREGGGPPPDIFTSGDRFMDHMELHDSISDMFRSHLVLAH